MNDKPTRQMAPKTWDGPGIFRTTTLIYDSGDRANGSLYLCDPTGGKQTQAVTQAITLLQGRSLWSAQEAKQVRDDQRQAYEDQLEFIEAVEIAVAGARLVLARCDHPKFPSSAERFSDWKEAFNEAIS